MKYIYQRSLLLYILLLTITSSLFFSRILPVIWIIFGTGVVFLSFSYMYRLARRWSSLPEKIFRKKVFWTALWIRVGYVLFSYVFFTIMTGSPFEFESADARFYDWEGARLADFFLSGNFNVGSLTYAEKLSSYGILTLIGVVYAMSFDSIIAFRIVNSLLGAWVCVMVYDIAVRSFGEKAAKISAIMAVVAPPLTYHCGLHLKEAVIVFLVVFFINTGDRLLRGKYMRLKDVLLFGGVAVLIFFFRNALAVVLILSYMTALLLTSGRVGPIFKRFAIVSAAAIFLMVFFSADLAPEVMEETSRYLGYSSSHIEGHMRLYAARGNKLATMASQVVFAPLAFIGPLPTLVNTNQDNAAMMAGALFFRNVLGFFMVAGILLMVKHNKWRNHVFLLAVFFSWLFVLANSGFALQERFHLILVPIIIIFSGGLIVSANQKMLRYFSMYLVFIGAVIFAWNAFKLAGRGLI